MLLVSSLDVSDCCGLELGGECPCSDPERGDSGMKDSGVVFRPFACQGTCEARARGAHWLTSRNTTNPSLAPSQEDRKMAEKETKTLVPKGVGSLRTWPASWIPLHAALWAPPGRIGSLASLQPTPPLPRCPGGPPQRLLLLGTLLSLPHFLGTAQGNLVCSDH